MVSASDIDPGRWEQENTRSAVADTPIIVRWKPLRRNPIIVPLTPAVSSGAAGNPFGLYQDAAGECRLLHGAVGRNPAFDNRRSWPQTTALRRSPLPDMLRPLNDRLPHVTSRDSAAAILATSQPVRERHAEGTKPRAMTARARSPGMNGHRRETTASNNPDLADLLTPRDLCDGFL